ncbi:sodium/potassium/calcium exchanger 4-like isoform X2 [Polistes fuscatus]|uniref:sodium/potassium/calcium exchanger 4-like isoform X2 n=1 Tax=Polistes fuscatus TaxID=30207 RepID=UPI001CA9E4C3|nr:sodium/potassium/calcium exchanger 4-like isoform X2 [Polistes fuscatus]
MARRHRHMIAFRILFVIAIPAMYFLCVSIGGYNSKDPTSLTGYKKTHLRRLLQTVADVQQEIIEENCTAPAIDEFPSDGFTRVQRQSGFIAIHFAIAIYLFLLLAIVCDDFFVPSIKKICEKLKLSEDVAGATIMAAASSSPELFINVVGTFITEGDLGVGTIVGSAVFNILAVPACCGLFAKQALQLEWWPITRDTLAYAFTVLLLIITLRNGRVEWYEGLILISFYILYISAMCFDGRIGGFLKRVTSKRKPYKNISENSPLLSNMHAKSVDIESFGTSEEEEALEIVSMTSWPSSNGEKIWWLLTWPINLALLVTIPDCRRPKLKSWYPLTFIMCIMWIASTSYVVGWVITIIGDTFNIPDSIMGLTFLAAGMSVPEAVSSVIVTNQGLGSMGISNSIGSNVFDVLLCLGLPWFVKSAIMPTIPGEHSVKINSQGLVYSSVSLFSTLFVLYVSLACNKFKLNRGIGITCLITYAIFLVFASVIELNIFFVVNLPICKH